MRPFTVAVPESELADLRDRLARTRWPDAGTVDGWGQGVPLDYARELCDYWARRYDWRRCEAELNALPQFRTGLDGGGTDAVEIHFLHQRSPHPNAMPLLLTHGWPSSVVEFLDVIDDLTNPPDPADAFHVVVPSLPGFGFSGKPTVAGWGVERIATAWAQLMVERLEYDRFAAAGGDWGSVITSALGTGAPEMLHGIHLTMPVAREPADAAPLSVQERKALARHERFREVGTAYSLAQSRRPQTLGYALADSPVGQCTWILEKYWDWADCAGDPTNVISRDRLLDNVMMYWLPDAAASSARLHWESNHSHLDEVPVPTGVTRFPQELVQVPRAWVERRYTDLRYWSEPTTGGHFAAMEQPDTYVEELRAFFRTLR